MSILGALNFFGPSNAQIRAAGGRVDPSGNVIWTLPSLSSTSSPSLTAFTNPYNISGGTSGSSFGSTNSIMDLTKNVGAANQAVVQNATGTATQSALAAMSKLDPYVANRFYENLETAFPGYKEMFSQMSGNAMSMLKGQIPSDAADMIRMYSAEQGMQGALANTARNLGLTSLDLTARGHAEAMDLFGLSEKLMPPVGDPYAMTENIRRDIVETGTLSPATALQAAVSLRAQDISQLQQAENVALERAKLAQNQSQFETEMNWARELSNLNRQFESWKTGFEMDMANKAMAVNAANQSAYAKGEQSMAKKFKDVLSMFKTPAGYTDTDLINQ